MYTGELNRPLYDSAHVLKKNASLRAFTAVFVVCIAISALCQTIEIWFLKQDHVERKHLRRNAIIKWIIVGTAIAAAIAFVGTYAACAGQPDDRPLTPRCDRTKSAAAVLEWLIAAL